MVIDNGILVVGVIVFSVLLYYESRNRGLRHSAWQAVALRFGLRSIGEELRGEIGPVSVHVEEEKRGFGKGSYTVTVWKFSFDDQTRLPQGLVMTPEGFFSKIGKLAGMEDVQLDLPEIDGKIIVRGADPDELRRWARQPRVLDALRALTQVTDSDQWILNNYELVIDDRRRSHVAKVIGERLTEFLAIAEGVLGVEVDPFRDTSGRGIPTMPSLPSTSNDEPW